MRRFIERTVIHAFGLVFPILLTACSSGLVGEEARRELRVTIIYTDRDTINAEARNRGFRSQVNGFYDVLKNEIWCPNEETSDAYRTCGHELRHAVRGPFHR